MKTTYALLERDLVGENNRNGGAVGSEGKENQPRGDELERAVAGSEKLQVKSGYSDNTRSMSRQLQKSRIYSLSLRKTAEARSSTHKRIVCMGRDERWWK